MYVTKYRIERTEIERLKEEGQSMKLKNFGPSQHPNGMGKKKTTHSRSFFVAASNPNCTFALFPTCTTDKSLHGTRKAPLPKVWAQVLSWSFLVQQAEEV